MIHEPIILAGGGGIGSWTVLGAIARIGFRCLTLYDPDIVEPHNMRNQAYYAWDVKKTKIASLRRYLRSLPLDQCGKVIIRHMRADHNFLRYCGIVICAVDSLEARQNIFRGVAYNTAVPLYIEAGAGPRIGIVYALDPRDPDQVDRYRRTLSGAATAAGIQPCVDPYMGSAFAAVIGSILADFSLLGWLPQEVQRTEMSFYNKPFMQTQNLPSWE